MTDEAVRPQTRLAGVLPKQAAAPRAYGIVVAFVLLFVVLSIASPAFLTTTNLLNLLDQNAGVGIIACGGTLVIIAGGFDLSVGAIYAFATVVAAKLAMAVDPVIGLMSGALAGLLLGAVNGSVLTAFKIHSFIATLATGYVFRGVATIITGGFLVSVTDQSFSTIGSDRVLGVKYSIWILLATILVTGFLLHRTRLGRYVYAVGGNAEAARLSGVAVDRVRAITFAISGLCAGIAGVLAASHVSTGQADTGVGLELTAIAAVVVGGTSIAGGEGAIWRTVLGLFLIAMMGNGFNLLSVPVFYQTIAQGLIILFAVGADRWSRRGSPGFA